MPAEKEYVKLWMSYADYFEPLDDAEIGCLVRAMISYKSSGVTPEFSGNERFVWPAIKRDIDQAIAAQAEFAEKQSKNGKKGGRPRKPKPFSENPKNPSLFSETQKSQGQRTKDKDKGQGQLSPDGDNSARARADAVAVVVRAYVDKINPTPSQSSIDELRGYAEQMGAECCLRAFDLALDAKKASWNYIRAILRSKLAQGVRCLADWDALDEQREKRKAPVTQEQKTKTAREDMERMRRLMENMSE